MCSQNAVALASVGKKRLRAHGDRGGMKYGKLAVAKIQLRDAGDMRKSENGHCTATKLTRNAAPSAADCAQRFHPPIRCRSRSITIAGYGVIFFDRIASRLPHRRERAKWAGLLVYSAH